MIDVGCSAPKQMQDDIYKLRFSTIIHTLNLLQLTKYNGWLVWKKGSQTQINQIVSFIQFSVPKFSTASFFFATVITTQQFVHQPFSG